MYIHIWRKGEVAYQIGWLQFKNDWRIEFWTYWVWGFAPHTYSLGFFEICKH